MKRLICTAATALVVAGFSVQTAEATNQWSTIAGACSADPATHQDRAYAVNSASIQYADVGATGSTNNIVMYCPVSARFNGSYSPSHLDIAYSGNGNTTNAQFGITAEYIKKSISSGALTIFPATNP